MKLKNSFFYTLREDVRDVDTNGDGIVNDTDSTVKSIEYNTDGTVNKITNYTYNDSGVLTSSENI